MKKDHKNWDECIPAVLFAYRSSVNNTTKDSPFFMLHDRGPRLPCDVGLMPPTELGGGLKEYLGRLVTQLQLAKSIASENNAKVQFQSEARKPHTDIDYAIGTKVWLYIAQGIKGLTQKLLFKWHGPYRIVQQTGPVNYKLEIAGQKVPRVVHVNRLKPYHDPALRLLNTPKLESPVLNTAIPLSDIPEESIPKTPQEVDHHEDTLPEGPCKVETILKQRKRNGITEYLVKWAGYPKAAATWEPEVNILDPRLLSKFRDPQISVYI